jgi:hypothetical protein
VVDELQQFEYRISPSRNVIYGAPDGAHDDCVISLALAYFQAQQAGVALLDREMVEAIQNYRGY